MFPIANGGSIGRVYPQAIFGHHQRRHQYQATGVSFDFRQLYVNGVKAVRARMPNLLPGNKPNFWKLSAGETLATATVIAPKVDTLLSIPGAISADQAHNITFSEIAFLYTNYLRPSNYGFLDAQTCQYNVAYSNNQQYAGRPSASVCVTCINPIRVDRNVFARMGATGHCFHFGMHDDMIIGNVVEPLDKTFWHSTVSFC